METVSSKSQGPEIASWNPSIQPGAWHGYPRDSSAPMNMHNLQLAAEAPNPVLLPTGSRRRYPHILPWKLGDLRTGDQDGNNVTQEELHLVTQLLSDMFHPCCPVVRASPSLPWPGWPRMTAQCPRKTRVCTAELVECRGGSQGGSLWPGSTQLTPLSKILSKNKAVQ